MSIASRALPLRVAMWRSRLRISTSAGHSMSPAVTAAGPRTSRRRLTASSATDVRTMSLTLRMMSVTSSATPLMVSNSWRASSNRTVVIAAPGIDESRVRRSELPSVWPKPGSSGPIANRCWLFVASPRASTVGRCMTSMLLPDLSCLFACVRTGRLRERRCERLLRVQLDDERLAHRHVDVLALGHVAHGDLLAAVTALEPAHEVAVEHVDVVLDDDHVRSLRRERDDVTLANTSGRDVDTLAVDADQAVVHELTGLRPRRRPPSAEHDVVEPGLEHDQQVEAGVALMAQRLLVGLAELALEHSVDRLRLLLLLQLGEVLAAGVAAAGAAVGAGREGTPVERLAALLVLEDVR